MKQPVFMGQVSLIGKLDLSPEIELSWKATMA